MSRRVPLSTFDTSAAAAAQQLNEEGKEAGTTADLSKRVPRMAHQLLPQLIDPNHSQRQLSLVTVVLA